MTTTNKPTVKDYEYLNQAISEAKSLETDTKIYSSLTTQVDPLLNSIIGRCISHVLTLYKLRKDYSCFVRDTYRLEAENERLDNRIKELEAK